MGGVWNESPMLIVRYVAVKKEGEESESDVEEIVKVPVVVEISERQRRARVNEKLRISGKKSEELERRCSECYITESSRWRRGPKGRLTLCNRCGLRWLRSTRKQREKLCHKKVVFELPITEKNIFPFYDDEEEQ